MVPISDGKLDLRAMTDGSREKLAAAIQADPEALGAMGIGGTVTAADPISVEHVNFLLNLYEVCERWLIPAYLKRKTKGQCDIPSDIAERAFTITKEQREKLTPPGALFLNMHLPDWLKAWISTTGPGAEFFTGLIMITWAQTHAAVEAWRETQPRQQPAPVQPVNGEAKDHKVGIEGVL
jgi:hypothetical protein